jgi:RNA polymerase sigma-70 factor (ECF subfamily)
MREAAEEDRARFAARVYAESGPRLYRYALMILANADDAADVVQQVFAVVLSQKRLPPIDDETAYFRAAVRNASYSLLRRRRTARDAEASILAPAAAGCSPLEQAALEQALATLSPEQREVVHLHVYEGMTFQEIATIADESINTVAARYRYALARLKARLAPG